MATPACKKYVLGEFVLEPDSLRLSLADVPVHLTHKPFQVLLYLIEHRDRMVTRHELLERFWQGHDVYDETLTKCVGAIRKALDDQTEQPRFIVTHWAEGYRYIGPLAEQHLEVESSIFGIEKIRGVRIVVEEKDNGDYPEPAGDEEIIPLEPRAEPLRLPAPRRSSRTVLAVSLLGLLALTATFLLIYPHRTYTGRLPNQPAPIRSIAVLPLRNLSGDEAQEYFGDGMTDSLITALSNIDGLKVISRGSVFQFKGKEIDPRDVGKQLGVAAVLEGSVRKDGDSVRVTVRLASTEDGRVLWASETYDRALRDLFSLQDEVARNVADGLKFQLIGQGKQKLAKPSTDNVEAYEMYLKGRFFWNQRNEEGLKKGITYFEQAIKIDPNYALAYAGLADSYVLLNLYSGLLQKEVFPKAKAAAEKALEMDDKLAEAQTTLAYVKYYYDWDWSGAEKGFKRAIEINRNYATAHQWYAEYLFYMERFDESIAEIERAHELDPLSLIINMELGSPYLYRRQYDQAIEKYRQTLEMDPSFPLARYSLALCYGQKSMYEQALATLAGGKDVSAEASLFNKSAVGYFYALSGRRREAQEMLAKLMRISRQQYYSPYLIAKVHIGLGEKDQAFAWLEKAYADRDERMVMLKVDPHLDSLRSDPRFTEFERRMGLPR